LGCSNTSRCFADDTIDAAILPASTADDLKNLEVSQVEYRRKLLAAIAAWRSDIRPLS
jgi:hypothetical protein